MSKYWTKILSIGSGKNYPYGRYSVDQTEFPTNYLWKLSL